MKSLLASTLFLIACGSSKGSFDPGIGNDPGSGTSTLTVDGSARARPRVSNAQEPGQFDTEFSVRVSLNGQEVTTGTVTMTSATGAIALVYAGGDRRWSGVASSYEEVYRLDVESGADMVKGVRVDGPDIHVFTKPTAGASVDSTMPLDVAWDAGETADEATIRTDVIDTLAIPDTGDYALAAGGLKAERDKVKQNTIRLTRTNRVTPAGAAGGSQLTVSVDNAVDVVALANPSL